MNPKRRQLIVASGLMPLATIDSAFAQSKLKSSSSGCRPYGCLPSHHIAPEERP